MSKYFKNMRRSLRETKSVREKNWIYQIDLKKNQDSVRKIKLAYILSKSTF